MVITFNFNDSSHAEDHCVVYLLTWQRQLCTTVSSVDFDRIRSILIIAIFIPLLASFLSTNKSVIFIISSLTEKENITVVSTRKYLLG